MSAAHTPGPWYVSKEFDGTSIKAGMFHVTHTIKACGFHEPEVDKAVTQANARLIAAAPDLLEALKKMVDIASDSRGVAGYHLNGEIAEWDEFPEWQAACAAIAKATGGAV
ncbi:MAG: hypothetical protein RL758_92 [Pseudomonadota bacterium]